MVAALAGSLSACAAASPPLSDSQAPRSQSSEAQAPTPEAPTPETPAAADRFAPPEGKGRLVFYRTGVPFLIALEPQFVVNDRAVGRAVHDRVMLRDALPGRYQVFMASDPSTVISFDLHAGEVKFIKAVIDFSLVGSHISATEVDARVAREEIGDRPLQTAKN